MKAHGTHYTHYMMVEALTDEAGIEFRKAWVRPSDQPGFIDGCLLTAFGRKIVIKTVWATREDSVRYHSSPAWMEFLAKMKHLIGGNYAVAEITNEPCECGTKMM